MKEDPGPLPDDIADLLARERDVPPLPERMRGRILARLLVSVGGAPTGSSGGTPGAAAGTASGAGASGTLLTVAMLGIGAVALSTGVVVAQRARSAPAPATEAAPAPAAVELVPVAPEVPAAPATSEDTRPSPPVAPRRPHRIDAPAPVVASPAEPEILEEARRALARGDAAATLTAVERHTAGYPEGQLAEEREALRIRALARLGRGEDARALEADFARRYPSSIHGPAVRAAVERSTP